MEFFGCLGVIIGVIFLLALSFLVTSGLIWLVCWAFSLAFSWKIAFGIWIAMILIRSCFKATFTTKSN